MNRQDLRKYFKGSKASLPPVEPKPEPRTLDAITQEHNNECWALGQLEYQIYVLNKNIDLRNKRIEELNLEGDARKKLNAAKETETEQVKND